MKWHPQVLISAAICLAAFFHASAAFANGLTVFPLRADLSAQTRIAAFNVKSGEATPTLMQVHLYAWTQTNGIDQLVPSDDLLVGPPIFTLPPGQTQLIRVGLRNVPTSNRETTYRIVIAEVPTSRLSGLTFAFRLSMPIFVSPPTPRGPRAEWSVDKIDALHIRLILDNAGDQHIHVVSLRVVTVPDQASIFNGSAVAYVLAGERRTWVVPVARGSVARSFRIDATIEGGVLNPPAFVKMP